METTTGFYKVHKCRCDSVTPIALIAQQSHTGMCCKEFINGNSKSIKHFSIQLFFIVTFLNNPKCERLAAPSVKTIKNKKRGSNTTLASINILAQRDILAQLLILLTGLPPPLPPCRAPRAKAGALCGGLQPLRLPPARRACRRTRPTAVCTPRAPTSACLSALLSLSLPLSHSLPVCLLVAHKSSPSGYITHHM